MEWTPTSISSSNPPGGSIVQLNAQHEQHKCDWTCNVEHIIGNMYRCSSGQVHICDKTCENRMPYGPTEEICFVSRRVFPKPPLACPALGSR